MNTSVADNYLNISSLNQIKNLSGKDSKAALQQVATQFETIFMKMMLKSMRDASFDDPLFDSDSAKFYRDMHDDQMSLELSKAGGVGIADMLVKQLERYLPQDRDQIVKPEANDITKNKELNKPESVSFETPKDFVQTLWPMAKQAAEKIGVSPKVLLAQAALETGWGKYLVRTADGSPSYNLFNIKADNRWQGEKASISTVEYVGGQARSQQADFRVYGSFKQSFDDYIAFLQQNPRYQNTLSVAGDDVAYLKSLQQAGYATDPKYANKIQQLLTDKSFTNVSAPVVAVQDKVS